MRTMLSAGEPVAKIAKECGIDRATVYREKVRMTGSGR
jgi:DNA invertase Pin-like site-specific DNA recombinase